jgi:radical SAM peptide maturase (CXXX-repeat target family)
MGYKKGLNPELVKTVVLVVTDDCNLACRYCYEGNKAKHKMSLETGKKAVDFMLAQPVELNGVTWEFIGGEPFLEIELVDQLCDYITERIQGHPWEKNYTFSLTTNGTLFDDPKVREFMVKDRRHKVIGVSLDGVKEIHDYNRCNSFDKIMENFHWWRKLYPWCSVKSTLNHESLPYICESAKFLMDLGLDTVIMNTANENIWQDGDEVIFKEQLFKLADYLLENHRYENNYNCLFDEGILVPADNCQNWCGCGSCMIAVDYKEELFPCLRFKTVQKLKPWVIGTLDTGIDENKVMPFYFCHNLRECDCQNCDTKSGCVSCTALNYDDTGTIFKRVSYACKLHKARVEANQYFFNKIAEIESLSMAPMVVAGVSDMDKIVK